MNSMENIFTLNNKTYSNNNKTLLEIIKKLELIINDINNNKKIDTIKKIKNIIQLLNNVIIENKNFINLIQEDTNKIVNELKELKNKIYSNNNINIKITEIYKNGKYIGEIKNGMRNGNILS